MKKKKKKTQNPKSFTYATYHASFTILIIRFKNFALVWNPPFFFRFLTSMMDEKEVLTFSLGCLVFQPYEFGESKSEFQSMS